MRKYYNECLLQKEILWRQKSRVDWLKVKEGDRNIKFSISKLLTAEAGIFFHNLGLMMAQLFMGSKTFRMKQLPIFLIYTSRTILDFGSS